MVVRADVLSQLRRGVLEYCVLAMLKKGERYGFDLVRTLGATDGLVTGEGTLYPLLSRLKRDGKVSATWRDSESGPPRKYYALTAVGQQSLSKFLSDWRNFSETVDGLLSGGEIT